MNPIRRWLAVLFSTLIILLSLLIVVAAGAQAAPDLDRSPIDNTQTVYDLGEESPVIGTDNPSDLSCDCDSLEIEQLEESPDRAVTVTRSVGRGEFFSQQQNESNGEQQEAPDPTPTEEQTEELTDQIGDLDIHSYEFREDQQGSPILLVEVTWNGRSPESMTITQLPGSDINRIAISRNRLAPDERTVVRVDLVDKSQPAVLYTDESLRNERAVVLDPNRNTSTETTLIRGVSIGILTALLGTVAAAVRYYRVDKDPVDGWEK